MALQDHISTQWLLSFGREQSTDEMQQLEMFFIGIKIKAKSGLVFNRLKIGESKLLSVSMSCWWSATQKGLLCNTKMSWALCGYG